MAISEQPATPEARRIEARSTRLVATLAAVGQPTAKWAEVVERVNVALWRMVHPLGAHRWRDGYEVDVDRGWTQYRGSRCTICDEPWEGW
ncbi:MAG: hypothetical protein FIA92_05185 [Chloroflexi bacterium]|nr:hypothetical protein [Chloroflexota bacterium]